MDQEFLDRVYNTSDPEELRALYDEWARNYEADVAKNGYATPDRCAAALRAFLPDPAEPVLDFGCGTGLSGLALSKQGFSAIDGTDPSDQMLRIAKEKGFYRALDTYDLGTALTHATGSYAAISAVGVIGSGAAPVDVLDILFEGLATGGKLVLSFNDHTLQDAEAEPYLMGFTERREARLLFSEHGPHLPGLDVGANVYVLEKT